MISYSELEEYIESKLKDVFKEIQIENIGSGEGRIRVIFSYVSKNSLDIYLRELYHFYEFSPLSSKSLLDEIFYVVSKKIQDEWMGIIMK